MMKSTAWKQLMGAFLCVFVLAAMSACGSSSSSQGNTVIKEANTPTAAGTITVALPGISNAYPAGSQAPTTAAYPAANATAAGSGSAYPAQGSTTANSLGKDSYYATWTLKQAIAGASTTLSVTDASGLLGKTVVLSQDTFTFGSDSCSKPTYTTVQTKLSTFLQTYKAEPGALSLPDGDAVSVSTQCKGTTYDFVQVSLSEMVYVYNGYFFVMNK